MGDTKTFYFFTWSSSENKEIIFDDYRCDGGDHYHNHNKKAKNPLKTLLFGDIDGFNSIFSHAMYLHIRKNYQYSDNLREQLLECKHLQINFIAKNGNIEDMNYEKLMSHMTTENTYFNSDMVREANPMLRDFNMNIFMNLTKHIHYVVLNIVI